MENKKGFTLIELLAVIIILSLLALLASTAVTKLVKDSKTDLNSIQLKSLKSSAEAWGAENIDLLPSSGTCGYMTLGELKEYGIVDSKIKDLTTNQELEDTLYIKITNTLNGYGKEVFTYEVNPESIDGCLKVYKEKVVLLNGYQFNDAIKTLANGTETTSNDQDTKVVSIEFLSGGILPEGYTLESLSQLPNSDLSDNRDDSIMAYYNSSTGSVYIYSEDLIAFNEECERMFREFDSLSNIEFGKIDTSNVVNMREIFSDCESLTNLDLSDFDTSNVTDMAYMFSYCESLTNLDLSSFDTSDVTNMTFMFFDCSSLTSLDLSSFDVSDVTNMAVMFNGCSSLTSLDLSSFYTINLTDMGSMFYGCKSLTNVDLSNFNTSNVTDMALLFNGCSSLTNLDLSSFDTKNVTDMSSMFAECRNLSLIFINSSTWNTSNADITSMFMNCGTKEVTPVY